MDEAFGTDIPNLPSISEIVPFSVPFTRILTPGNDSPASSKTVPVMVIGVWALTPAAKNSSSIINLKLVFFMKILFICRQPTVDSLLTVDRRPLSVDLFYHYFRSFVRNSYNINTLWYIDENIACTCIHFMNFHTTDVE